MSTQPHTIGSLPVPLFAGLVTTGVIIGLLIFGIAYRKVIRDFGLAMLYAPPPRPRPQQADHASVQELIALQAKNRERIQALATLLPEEDIRRINLQGRYGMRYGPQHYQVAEPPTPRVWEELRPNLENELRAEGYSEPAIHDASVFPSSIAPHDSASQVPPRPEKATRVPPERIRQFLRAALSDLISEQDALDARSAAAAAATRHIPITQLSRSLSRSTSSYAHVPPHRPDSFWPLGHPQQDLESQTGGRGFDQQDAYEMLELPRPVTHSSPHRAASERRREPFRRMNSGFTQYEPRRHSSHIEGGLAPGEGLSANDRIKIHAACIAEEQRRKEREEEKARLDAYERLNMEARKRAGEELRLEREEVKRYEREVMKDQEREESMHQEQREMMEREEREEQDWMARPPTERQRLPSVREDPVYGYPEANFMLGDPELSPNDVHPRSTFLDSDSEDGKANVHEMPERALPTEPAMPVPPERAYTESVYPEPGEPDYPPTPRNPGSDIYKSSTYSELVRETRADLDRQPAPRTPSPPAELTRHPTLLEMVRPNQKPRRKIDPIDEMLAGRIESGSDITSNIIPPSSIMYSPRKTLPPAKIPSGFRVLGMEVDSQVGIPKNSELEPERKRMRGHKVMRKAEEKRKAQLEIEAYETQKRAKAMELLGLKPTPGAPEPSSDGSGSGKGKERVP
ncbi:hypothetical protein EJ06DRAFT_559042 [Trichodelitschia bisporula]|uniref:Uncharacterized protein n=1 Tax=Trichodelitschia bisporula TaxID=703511 RepID=A0A6G1HN43_9PEZI|nr:hypothetical protein EJ06DRAFT_559042 [Trichodelitschia bisporula]